MAETTSDTHLNYLSQALDMAKLSPPQPTNYRVGALLVEPASATVLARGFTLELPGNTHAEQCCLAKLAARLGLASEEDLSSAAAGSPLELPTGLALYTTVEPCVRRLSGNLPCVERILRLPRGVIADVYVGLLEPETFVQVRDSGRRALEDAGIRVHHVPGLEDEILRVATAGHVKEPLPPPAPPAAAST